MEKLYFALVDTPGFFAEIIRKTTKINYCHVSMAFDPKLENVYSVGRRNPAVTFFAGFIKEDTQKIAKVFPTAKYKIIAIDCTLEQKQMLQAKMEACYPKRFQYHYCIIGLPFILLKKPFYQKNHYTCSSFLARCLQEVGLDLFEKHFSLVTPRDFYELENTDFLYEGLLTDFLHYENPLFVKGEVYGT